MSKYKHVVRLLCVVVSTAIILLPFSALFVYCTIKVPWVTFLLVVMVVESAFLLLVSIVAIIISLGIYVNNGFYSDKGKLITRFWAGIAAIAFIIVAICGHVIQENPGILDPLISQSKIDKQQDK